MDWLRAAVHMLPLLADCKNTRGETFPSARDGITSLAANTGLTENRANVRQRDIDMYGEQALICISCIDDFYVLTWAYWTHPPKALKIKKPPLWFLPIAAFSSHTDTGC